MSETWRYGYEYEPVTLRDAHWYSCVAKGVTPLTLREQVGSLRNPRMYFSYKFEPGPSKEAAFEYLRRVFGAHSMRAFVDTRAKGKRFYVDFCWDADRVAINK